MSTDNTIAILATRRRDGQPGLEFRVAEVMAIENIWHQPDYPSVDRPVLNREMVRGNFRKSNVFYNEEDARSAAKEMEKTIEFVEYGIKYFEFANTFFPASDSMVRRRRNRKERNLGAQQQMSDEARTCWCPCPCGRTEPGDIIDPSGLCSECASGNHEVPSEESFPSTSEYLLMCQSVVIHYQKVLEARKQKASKSSG
jgi:hypothetical protein